MPCLVRRALWNFSKRNLLSVIYWPLFHVARDLSYLKLNLTTHYHVLWLILNEKVIQMHITIFDAIAYEPDFFHMTH